MRLIAFSLLLWMPSAFSSPPNIVLIMADDLGYADVSFQPDHAPHVHTPRLEALARESIIFRQGYVSGNVCSPTRAGLMTGRYQQRRGLYTGGEAGSGLPLDEAIFPQFLRPAGYVCGQFGKWHLGPTLEWSPAHRGFDEVFGFLGRGAHDYFVLDNPEDPIYRGTTPVKETGYLTDRLGEEAATFIRTHRERPFFVYLAFNAVHAPLQAPDEDIGQFNTGDASRNTLLAMGRRLDSAVGLVVDALEESGVRQNTLIAFLSDNGGPPAQTADNRPLRGGKHQDYEGGVRIPFILGWPARLQAGVSDAVVSSLDLLPTALAAAGLKPPADRPFDGIDLLPVLGYSAPPAPRDLFWSSGETGGWWAVRSGDWKLVCEHGSLSLFDLAADPSEARDQAATHPERVQQLTALHAAWLQEMAPPAKGGTKRVEPGQRPAAKRKKV